ncbi:MAG: SpoIIE family protein phosphatase [Bacteroidales bacterium]|nr:SpoIIE family protein phosphatase [Bacteroidales bacterium]
MTLPQQYDLFIRRFIPVLIVLLFSCVPTAFSQVYKVKEHGVNNGLPQPYVYSMNQDATGHLWIGTGDGLARYNGKTFQVFTTSDSLCDNFITTSLITDRGAWFGHMNGGISLFNGTAFIKVVPGGQGTSAITDLKVTGSNIWASTQSSGIWKIQPTLETTLYSDPSESVTIFSLEMLSSTECLVGSMEGVYVYAIESESNTLRLIGPLEGLPETKVQDLLRSKNEKELFILTQDEGIFTYNVKQYSLQTEPLGFDMEIGIEGPQQIYEDKDLNLWIPTFGSGLYKLTLDTSGNFLRSVNYMEENGLPGNNVKMVFQDREENIWLGMYGTGLARLVDEAYTYYNFEDPILNNSVHSIYISEESRWFGTEEGLISCDETGGEIQLVAGSMHGLPDDIITAISVSPDGDLWVGTKENGIFRKSKGAPRFESYYISSGILENSINALSASGSLLWVATEKGICKIDTETDVRSWFTISNAGLPHNTINYLQVDEDGKVWLSTLSNTISYLEDDTVTRWVIPAVVGAINIRSITMDKNDQIWVGTYGNGVFKIEGDSATNITTRDGLLSDYCYSLVSDDVRYIWVSHRGGLSRIRLSDGYVSTVEDEVGIDKSMEFNVNAVFKDKSGILWFGSTSGVLSYDPQLEKRQPPPPALALTSILVNKKEAKVSNQLNLAPGRHDLRIQFMGVNLKKPEAVTYQYKMEGLGNAWSEDFTEDYVIFNKLPDGKYTFNLRAFNSEGISDDNPVKLHIVISKPLWKRWWFYALLLILVSATVVAYIKRREHNLLAEKRILEERVRERTEEVVKQKEEIEIQRDEIRLINQNITDSITYASRIQQAIFPPAELLTTYFPESFILSRPQYIVSGDFFWIGKKKDKLVVAVADCTGHGVPGAFMSMLGITLLNELVNHQSITESNEILNSLKKQIIQSLRQKGDSESTSDGMDMALCVVDPGKRTLQYSGGFNPLIIIRDGELIMYKADPMPIGIGAITGRVFTKHDINLQKGDLVYLYSDGYEDQFGGEKDKKFSRKRFRNLLLEIHSMPVPEQKAALEKALDAWMDGHEQVDDITVMGIKF